MTTRHKKAKMAALKTVDIRNVELARIGTFEAVTGKVTFTRKDFDDMASASKELVGKIDFPLKLGHNEDQELLQEDGLPAAGWLENVKRVGDSLIVDFMRVPAKIADIIKAGGFRKRSLEGLRNAEFLGKRFPMVLTGAALLGEDLPAVDSLDDIASLYIAAGLGDFYPESADEAISQIIIMPDAKLALHDDDEGEDDKDLDGIIKDLQSLSGRSGSSSRRKSMIATVVKELRSMGKISAEGDDVMDRKKMAVLLGLDVEDLDDEAIEKAILELKTKVDSGDKGGSDDGLAKVVKDQADELKEQGQEILDLKTKNATDEAKVVVDDAIKTGRFVPAVHDELVKMAVRDPKSFKLLVEGTPEKSVFASGTIGSQANSKDGTFDLADYEPTADDLIFMKQTTITREEFILTRMEELGITSQVPELVLAKLRGDKKSD